MESKSTARRILRWTACILGILLLLVFILFLVVFRGRCTSVLWRQEAYEYHSQQHRAGGPPVSCPLERIPGHRSQSFRLSHDSEVSFETILQVLKVDCDFIALSDHCLESGTADYGASGGVHDGKLFIPVLRWAAGSCRGSSERCRLGLRKPLPELAAEIEQKGGLLFIAHSEEPRLWELPQIRA